VNPVDYRRPEVLGFVSRFAAMLTNPSALAGFQNLEIFAYTTYSVRAERQALRLAHGKALNWK